MAHSSLGFQCQNESDGIIFFFLSLSLFHFVFKTNVDELIGRLIATLKEFETNLAVVMGDPKF